jgi:hypothetical protein
MEDSELDALCREAEVHVVYTKAETALIPNPSDSQKEMKECITDLAQRRCLEKIIELKLDYMKSKNPRYAVEAFLFVCAIRKRESIHYQHFHNRRSGCALSELRWMDEIVDGNCMDVGWYLTDPEWVIDWLGEGFLTYHYYWEENVHKNPNERSKDENRLEQILALRDDFSGGKHCYKPDHQERRNLYVCRQLLFLSKLYGITAEGEGIEIMRKKWVNDYPGIEFPQASILKFYRKSSIVKDWKKDPNSKDWSTAPNLAALFVWNAEPWAKIDYLKYNFPIEDISPDLKRKIIKKLFPKKMTPRQLELEVTKYFTMDPQGRAIM